MTTLSNTPSALPTRNVVRAMRAAENTPAATIASVTDVRGHAPSKTFARAFELGTLNYNQDRKTSVGYYWEATRAATTIDEAMRVVDVAFASTIDRLKLDLGLIDLGAGAMNKALRMVKTYDEALDLAVALYGKGMGADDFAKGALHRALDSAATPEEALAVASFAQEAGMYRRYGKIEKEAREKSRVLASNQGPAR